LFDRAVALLTQAHSRYPERNDYTESALVVISRDPELREAEDLFRQVISIETSRPVEFPGNAINAHLWLALLYRVRFELDKCISVSRTALALLDKVPVRFQFPNAPYWGFLWLEMKADALFRIVEAEDAGGTTESAELLQAYKEILDLDRETKNRGQAARVRKRIGALAKKVPSLRELGLPRSPMRRPLILTLAVLVAALVLLPLVRPSFEQVANETRLLHAAGRGDSATLLALLRRGTDPNCRPLLLQWPRLWVPMTPLTWAAHNGQLECARLLLAGGARVDVEDNVFSGMTPIAHAVSERHQEIARLLLDHGADPTTFAQGVPLLVLATRNDDDAIVRVLLEKGADPTANTGPLTASAVDEAVGECHPKALRVLLERTGLRKAADAKWGDVCVDDARRACMCAAVSAAIRDPKYPY
jgi:hypothetical protein